MNRIQTRVDPVRLFLIFLSTLLFTTGCKEKAPETFRLDAFLTDDSKPIPLNRPLIFQFRGGLVDAASLHGGSIQIEDVSGTVPGRPSADGRFEVSSDNRVVFIPKVGSKADFSDGGFRPGRKYRVVVLGFPQVSGVRSTDGQVLEKRHVFYFTTIPSGRDLFEDQAASARAILTTDSPMEYGLNGIQQVTLDPGAKLKLISTKPLRPDTVVPANITIRTGPRDEHKLPIDVLLANEENGARIEIDLKIPLEAGTPALVEFDTSVTDLGGNVCQGPAANRFFWAVEPRGYFPGLMTQEFLHSNEQERPEVRDATIATATWRGDGKVCIHFPAIAADGRDGIVKWTDKFDAPQRVRAGRFIIEKTADVRVNSGSIFTAQTGITIEGRIRLQKNEITIRPEDVAAGVPSDSDLVIVAGGDVVLDGEITGAGNVFVAAGGAVWITRNARIKCKNLRIAAPAGVSIEGDVPPEREIVRNALPEVEKLQLSEHLIFRATSTWIRAASNHVLFANPQWLGDAGSSRMNFRYRSARSIAGQSGVDPKSISNWMNRPEDLPAGDRLQFTIDFIISNSDSIQPLKLPFVDRLQIATRRY
ncbi:MAG: hypothetical protein ACKVS6_14595 [Planctomycetota bacterium]